MFKSILFALCLLWANHLFAAELILKPVQVYQNVYAVIGDLGGQTYENEGLNANLGFVVTTEGVLVINSGSSARVAKALHDAIRKVTSKPVMQVINVNSQSHYWLGNSYFQALNIPVIAHTEAKRLMLEMGETQLASLKNTLKDKAEGTKLAYPAELVKDKSEIKLAG